MNPIHILLVEDNEGDILLTTEALIEGNIAHTLSVVKDGWDAIQFLEKKEKYCNESLPDVILLDVNLPKMNGHEVVKHIRSVEKIKQIPVIMLSTSSSSKDILLSSQNQVNSFLTKPVEIRSFLKALSLIGNLGISILQKPDLNNIPNANP